jgi:hypothetical protein
MADSTRLEGSSSSFLAVRHGREEFGVRLRLAHLGEQQFHRLHGGERREDLSKHPHPAEILLGQEQLLLARAALLDVDPIAGNTRRSASFLSRWISRLPVPLNSSKMTSSMREPVSMSAVATIVSDPPCSMLRAAPKNRFGRWRALLSTPPERTLPEAGTIVL